MKKALVWILTLCLCATCILPAGALAQQETAEDRLLLDWFYYLFSYEKIISNMQWACEYVDVFVQDRTWENLLTARAAVSVAQEVIDGVALPEASASAEDYMEFMLDGKDLSFIQFAYESFEGDVQRVAASRCMDALKPYLQEEVFWTYTAEMYEKCFQVWQTLMECELAALALDTNHIINALNSSAGTERIVGFLQNNCPQILKYQQEFTGDDTALQQLYEQIYQKNEAADAELAQLNGQAAYAADLYIQAIESNDFSRMISEKTEIANLPLMLPYPGWYSSDADSFHYLWRGNDGSLTKSAEYEELVCPPDVCLMTAQSVPLQDVKMYRDYLDYLGLSCTKTEESNERCRLYYLIENTHFVLTHENSRLEWYMSQNPVCLVPEWYLYE